MVLYASDFDQSKYLKAADLGEIDSEKRLKIKTVTKEIEVGEKQETKACVWFTNIDKGLLLNKTNLRVLQGAFGNDMELWAGKIIVAVFDHGLLPRPDGPLLAGADSAAEGGLQGTGVATETDAKAAG